jgi:hypothetical protein
MSPPKNVPAPLDCDGSCGDLAGAVVLENLTLGRNGNYNK